MNIRNRSGREQDTREKHGAHSPAPNCKLQRVHHVRHITRRNEEVDPEDEDEDVEMEDSKPVQVEAGYIFGLMASESRGMIKFLHAT